MNMAEQHWLGLTAKNEQEKKALGDQYRFYAYYRTLAEEFNHGHKEAKA